jgi:hypothetical protein
LLVGVVMGLVWLVTVEIAGPDPAGPTASQTAAQASAKKAASAPRTPPNLGMPKGKELRTEAGKAYAFIERTYEPAHRLPLLEEPVKSRRLSSPEEVVTSLASAIRQLEWQWFLGLWDERSRNFMVDTMDKADFAPARRLAQWRRNYVGKEMQITRRIDMAGYALVSLSPTDGHRDTWDKIPPLTTKRDPSGRWWLTHDLRAHPVQSMDLGLDPVTIIDRGPGP